MQEGSLYDGGEETADRGNSSWKYFSCVHAHVGVGMTFPDELSPATDGKCAPPRPMYVYARGGVRVPLTILFTCVLFLFPTFFFFSAQNIID